MGGEFPKGESQSRGFSRAIGRRSVLAQGAKAIGLLGLGLMGCTPKSSFDGTAQTEQARNAAENPSQTQSGIKLTFSSAAFPANGMIPAKYTCDGENLSPALSWDQPPTATKSLAVLVTDPDAPGKAFVHWVLYDLPPDLRQLPEGVPTNPLLSQGGTQGKSDFGKFGYGGPCPPKAEANEAHRYVFKLYALDKFLDLPPGVSQVEVVQAMEGHTLAEAELIGRYRRP